MPEVKFKCLRCGHEYLENSDPALEPVERTCPKCRSNSIRPMPASAKDERPARQ